MKKIIIIITIFLLHFSAILAFAEDAKVKEIIKILNESLPKSWQTQTIEPDIIPNWSFTEDKCILIKTYGPNMAGYKYFRKDGSYIGERKIFNEAVMFWVGYRSFNPQLSLFNRVKNSFTHLPRRLPIKIFAINGYTIYGREGLITLPKNEAANKTSPEGTLSAIPIKIENGRSWIMWEKHILKSLEENF